MLGRTTERDQTNKIEASSNVAGADVAAAHLFADAYDLPQRKGRSQGSAMTKDLPTEGTATPVRSSTESSDLASAGKQPSDHEDFPYQSIYRNVAPELHTLAAGETLESMARRHLGEGATDEEVQHHIQEIKDLNSGASREAGSQLVLPGHSDNGDIVLLRKDGSLYTISGDPAERARELQEFVKPPLAAAPVTPPDQNRGCYEVRVDYDYAVSDHGRTVIVPYRSREMRCPGQDAPAR